MGYSIETFGGANVNSKAIVPPIAIAIMTFAALMIALLAMRSVGEILAPILLALILAICMTPLLNWFVKKGAPGWLALVITIGLVVILLLLLVWMVGSSVQGFFDGISAYDQRLEEIQRALGGALNDLGVNTEDLAAIPELTQPAKILQLIAGFVGGIVSGLSNWGLILMVSVFFLVEALSMPHKMASVAAREDDPRVKWLFGLVKSLREYMVINASVGALAAGINTLLLWALGIEFAILWGILSFFLSFVPSVGFLISVIPPALLAFIQFGTTQMLIVIVAYVVINFLVDNVIKPRFIAHDLNISATVTFLSLIIWGWVLGPAGAILAVPMSIIVQAILASREESRWLAYLMGTGQEPFRPEEDLVMDQDALEPTT